MLRKHQNKFKQTSLLFSPLLIYINFISIIRTNTIIVPKLLVK